VYEEKKTEKREQGERLKNVVLKRTVRLKKVVLKRTARLSQKKAIEQRMWWEKWRKVSEERSEHGYRWKAQ
jgi:hypothetical protein